MKLIHQHKLYFNKSFYKNGYVLGKKIPPSLRLTKVINETISMNSGSFGFTGVFIPTFDVDLNTILLSFHQYIFSTFSSISLEISFIESSYYENNLQQPMTGKSQVTIQTILFTMVYLGLFRFIFLLYKLLLKPIHDYIQRTIYSFYYL